MEEIWRLFESAEHEELCARLEKDGSLGKVLCKEASCKVTRLAGDVKNAALLHACAIAAAMRGIEDEMVAYRDARISGGVGMRKDSEAFSAVCGFLLRLEERRAELGSALAACTELYGQAEECRVRLSLARGTVLTVRAKTDADTDGDLAAIECAETEYARVTSALWEYRDNVLAFFSGTMEHFFQRLQESADFVGKGAACDWREIDALCDALQYAIKSIQEPCFE